MLGDDGAVGNDNDRPVELALEVSNDLVSDLSESGEWAEGNADKESLGGRAVGLLVLNEVNRVDEHLGQLLLKARVVNL